jgi:hypothetical protein
MFHPRLVKTNPSRPLGRLRLFRRLRDHMQGNAVPWRRVRLAAFFPGRTGGSAEISQFSVKRPQLRRKAAVINVGNLLVKDQIWCKVSGFRSV